MRWRRGELSGVIGFGLLFIALFLPGPPPKADDSVEHLTATLVDHRDAFVRGTVLAGVAALALLWFIGELSSTIRAADRQNAAAATAVLTGGSMAVVFMLGGMLLFNGPAFKAAAMGDPAVVRAAVDTGNMVVESSKLGFAMLVFATCAATAIDALLSPWLRRVGRVTAVALVASSVPPYFAEHGIGQFGGAIDLVGAVPAFAWLLVFSVIFARRGANPAAPIAAS